MRAHLRNGDRYERLADGFGVGVATVCRYVHEAVDLLADLARSLTAALRALAWTWRNFAVLDGTVVQRAATSPATTREANRAHAATRARGERGLAVLKTWNVFTRFRGCPRRVGTFARAVLTLEDAFHE